MPGYAKSAHHIFPYEVLDFLGSYLGDWLDFSPFGEVFNGDNKVFHLTNGKRERSQDVYSPSMERPWIGDKM